MPRVSDVYSSSFLNAAELTPLGQPRTAMVHDVAVEELGQDRHARLILDLVSPSGQAWPKRVVLNKSNALQLTAAFGDNTDDWLGKPITIWAENVMYQGKFVPGIKVRFTPPAAQGNGSAGAPTPTPRMPPPDPQTITMAGGVTAPIPSAAPAGNGYPGPETDLNEEIPF